MYDGDMQSGKTEKAVDHAPAGEVVFMEIVWQIILLLIFLEIIKTIKK